MNNTSATQRLTAPLSDAQVRALKIGDQVLLSGVILTGRDAAHKWLLDTFIEKTRPPEGDDERVYREIRRVLDGGVLYHCGPVVSGLDTGQYQFVAAGPTTSIREEPYQDAVLRHFNIKGVIGKGGMGQKTLSALREVPGAYFHAVGGAGTLISQCVQKVIGVYKLEFGAPEALWVIEVQDFPLVVTMDAHGGSLHENVRAESESRLSRLISDSL